jgi:hypothetical protein
MTKTLTNSQRKSFFSCPRRWQFENIIRRRPVEEKESLVFGTAFHRFLEDWWRVPNSNTVTETGVLADPYQNAKLSAMIKAYAEYWSKYQGIYRCVNTEVEFDVPIHAVIGNSRWRLRGKIDATVIVADVNNDSHRELWLVEHKTSSEDISLGSKYWQRLEIDGQIEGYMLGYMKWSGVMPSGIIYDVAKKPRHKPLLQGTAHPEPPEEYFERCYAAIMKTPHEYFIRQSIYKTADKLAEYERNLYHCVKLIDYCVRNDFFPANADGCVGFGTCPYFAVCAGQADIADNTKFQDVNPNPELSIKEAVNAVL